MQRMATRRCCLLQPPEQLVILNLVQTSCGCHVHSPTHHQKRDTAPARTPPAGQSPARPPPPELPAGRAAAGPPALRRALRLPRPVGAGAPLEPPAASRLAPASWPAGPPPPPAHTQEAGAGCWEGCPPPAAAKAANPSISVVGARCKWGVRGASAPAAKEHSRSGPMHPT